MRDDDGARGHALSGSPARAGVSGHATVIWPLCHRLGVRLLPWCLAFLLSSTSLADDADAASLLAHNQSVAAERINALIQIFEGWLEPKQLVRIK